MQFSAVNVEVVTSGESAQTESVEQLHSALWQTAGQSEDSPHAETVTVTLTHNPGEGE